MNNTIYLGKGGHDAFLLSHMANRHGLIAGATGTGKTVTLKVLAEGFSNLGVPVFMADVKGDLASISQPGSDSAKLRERLAALGRNEHVFTGFPTTLWDVFGEQGHPVRATISELGPLLLARLLNLNEVQAGVLTIVFRVADDNGFLLLDLKDLRAVLQYVAENSAQLTTSYGNVSSASVGAIQRGLLELEEQGGQQFFGEPALNIDDLMQTDRSGRGVINVLSADKLMNSPRIYSTFLLWLLAELFEALPEVGDVEKPRMVFFFDEAHLLFSEAPKALLEKIEQVVRLIRSKGVGVYFVTQNPLDIPESVAAQLGNRVQHALRAFSAKDQKAVRAAAETFRSDGSFDVASAVTELAIGEALVSTLDQDGAPTHVQRTLIAPPASRFGALTSEERRAIISNSLVAGHYERAIDRESAYEQLKTRAQREAGTNGGWLGGAKTTPSRAPQQQPAQSSSSGSLWSVIFGGSGGGRKRQTPVEAMVSSTARAIGNQLGRQIMRGVLGSLSRSR